MGHLMWTRTFPRTLTNHTQKYFPNTASDSCLTQHNSCFLIYKLELIIDESNKMALITVNVLWLCEERKVEERHWAVSMKSPAGSSTGKVAGKGEVFSLKGTMALSSHITPGKVTW